MYLSPNIPVTKQELHSVLSQLPRPLLLLGDMNAKHISWGEEDSNSRGTLFEEFLNETDLCLLNDSAKTHYSAQHNSHSLIDLSLSSANCFGDFQCSVLPHLHGSDHYPITVEKLNPPVVGEPSYRFITEKADWGKYYELTKGCSTPPQEMSIEESVQYVTTSMLDAAEASIPISKDRKNGKIPVPWWSGGLLSVMKYTKREIGQKKNSRDTTMRAIS